MKKNGIKNLVRLSLKGNFITYKNLEEVDRVVRLQSGFRRIVPLRSEAGLQSLIRYRINSSVSPMDDGTL